MSVRNSVERLGVKVRPLGRGVKRAATTIGNAFVATRKFAKQAISPAISVALIAGSVYAGYHAYMKTQDAFKDSNVRQYTLQKKEYNRTAKTKPITDEEIKTALSQVQPSGMDTVNLPQLKIIDRLNRKTGWKTVHYYVPNEGKMGKLVIGDNGTDKLQFWNSVFASDPKKLFRFNDILNESEAKLMERAANDPALARRIRQRVGGLYPRKFLLSHVLEPEKLREFISPKHVEEIHSAIKSIPGERINAVTKLIKSKQKAPLVNYFDITAPVTAPVTDYNPWPSAMLVGLAVTAMVGGVPLSVKRRLKKGEWWYE